MVRLVRNNRATRITGKTQAGIEHLFGNHLTGGVRWRTKDRDSRPGYEALGKLKDDAPFEQLVASAELNTYQAQCAELKYEAERTNRELSDVKRRYYEKKRKEAAERERLDGGASKPSATGSFQPRFTGGGFSLAS